MFRENPRFPALPSGDDITSELTETEEATRLYD